MKPSRIAKVALELINDEPGVEMHALRAKVGAMCRTNTRRINRVLFDLAKKKKIIAKHDHKRGRVLFFPYMNREMREKFGLVLTNVEEEYEDLIKRGSDKEC